MSLGAKIGAAFAVGLAIILAIGAGAYFSTQRLLDANRRVINTHEVMEELGDVLSVLKDAETGQRGFVLTGAERYLEPYNAANDKLQHDIDALLELTRGNAAELDRLRQVQKLADAKLAELRETIELRRKSGLAATVPVILTDRGKKIMDELRNVVNSMDAQEQQALDQENEAANAAASRSIETVAIWMPLAMLVLAVAGVVLMRNVRFGGPSVLPGTIGETWSRIALQYAAAVVVVAVAIRLRFWLIGSFGPLPCFITFFPAVLLVVSIGGGGPGIFATVLAALAADFWFIPPYGSFRIDAPNDAIALGIFTGSSLFLSVLAERLRRSRWAEAVSAAQQQQLSELSRLNEELSQQSEELSQQSEELAQQNEELQTQSEEIQTLNAELMHREDVLQKLLDAARLSSAEQAVMHDVCAAAKEMFGSTADVVMVFERQGSQLSVRAHAGLGPDGARLESLPAENCFAALVIEENKTAALADAALRPDLLLIHPPGEDPFRAVLAAPMRAEGRPFGAVGIYSRHTQEWTAEQFRLVEWLAAQCARILETLRLQEQLRRLYAEQQAIFDSVPAMIWYKDTKNNFVRVNRAVSSFVGKPLNAIEGKSAFELFPEEAEHYYRDDMEVISSGQPKLGIMEELETASGEKRWVLTDKIPYRGETGNISGVLVFTLDITERKRAEEQVAQLAAIVESSDDAILSTDLDAVIRTWNAGADRLFGYRAEEVVGKPIALLLPPERIGEEEQILDWVRNGHRVEHLETVRVAKDGRRFDVSVTVSPVKDRNGRIVGASKILRDITQRKQAEEALRRTADEMARSNKDLEQFAYVASHDLREPLRMVTGFLGLLKDHCSGKLDAKADEYIFFASDAATRMQGLIDDLLTYARTGQSEMTEPTNVGDVLDKVLRTLSVSIEKSAAVITHDTMPTITSKPLELTRVFQNLIGNAIKFRGERKPEIHVGVRRQPDGWLFTVRDNGIGLDGQFADRIFMIFQRLHTREQYPGTGIGLAICKKVVERHGGRIWVESQPGEGSTFCFTIPDQEKEQG
jgi:hypothetical protein